MSDPFSSKAWVERQFPAAKGRVKAAMILAHGAGYDAGMAHAEEIIMRGFELAGGTKRGDRCDMEALTKNVSKTGEWWPMVEIRTEELPRYGLIQYKVFIGLDGSEWCEYDPFEELE